MKKTVAILLCIIFVACCFSSCGKSAEVKAIEEKIDAIEEINLKSEDVIEEIRTAYDALTAEDKKKVKNYDDFEAVLTDFSELEKINGDAQALKIAYEKIFAEYGFSVETVKKPFEEISEKCSSCSARIKAACDEIMAELRLADEKYAEVAEDAIPSAKTYVNGFLALKGGDVSVKEIGCIAQISDGIPYYLFALTYDDSEGTDKKVYSIARYTGTPSTETMTKFAYNFYTDAPSLEKTDALKNGNVVIDVSAVVTATK